MQGNVSTTRVHVLRVVYALNFVGLGLQVWPALLGHGLPWDPLHGVAYSFWAALSLLMGVGIRYPLQMLPVLLIQLAYKSIWLLAVFLPTWAGGGKIGFTMVMLAGVVVDLVVIPWTFVLANYVTKAPEPWR